MHTSLLPWQLNSTRFSRHNICCRKDRARWWSKKKRIYQKSALNYLKAKAIMHGRRAANVHLAIRKANYRGRYCCRVNSPEKAHSYSHGRRAVNHAYDYLHGGRYAGKSCIVHLAIRTANKVRPSRQTLYLGLGGSVSLPGQKIRSASQS